MSVSEQVWRAMQEAAKAASKRAYCPYSRFPVGAAVLTSSGSIYAGCNVENASFGLTSCAERNAIFQMVAAGEREIQALLVFTPTESATAPCGACRQVIVEFGPTAAIRCVSSRDERSSTLADLLPFSFGPHNLKARGETRARTEPA